MERKPSNTILPMPLRVGADERFTGRGITIAFIDSGFYPHSDLTEPQNRVLHYTSLPDPQTAEEDYHTITPASWHGTMTSVVAAGNGFLSNGTYRGIASEANLVLIKVGSNGHLRSADIQQGIEWVIQNRERYDIRILNISAGGDEEASYLTDKLSQTAEDAVRAGIVVVCAAGNAGDTPDHPIYPPASTPAVITVGGINDHNSLNMSDDEMYHSSYGPTIDGLQKPEIVAPSIWVAAPILPQTEVAIEAQTLTKLQQTPTGNLSSVLKEELQADEDWQEVSELHPKAIRQVVNARREAASLINESYKHVEGTSFAAPIVSSVIAQMLEVNPRLTPSQVKRILLNTAVRLPDMPAEKQGWGTIIAARALQTALQLKVG